MACIEDKQHRIAFLNKGWRRSTKPLEIVHSDVCGPMLTTFMDGVRYFVNEIVVVCVEIQEKNVLRGFKALAETQSKHHIKMFHLNNGGGFVCKAISQFLKDHGIEKQTSTLYMPQQNGVAEHVIEPLWKCQRTCSKPHQIVLGKKWWLMRFTRKINVLLWVLDFITPKEMWNGRRPWFAHMQVFECVT